MELTYRLRTAGLALLGVFLSFAAPAQGWPWVAATGLTSAYGVANCQKMARDGAGNIVVAGEFTGTVQVGGTVLTSAGQSDVFVAWLSPTGAWLRVAQAGGDSYDMLDALAVDAAGNVAIAGHFQSPTMTVGPFSLVNPLLPGSTMVASDAFVAKLSPAGAWTQAVQMGGTYYESCGGLAWAANGELVVAGSGNSPQLTFGSFQLINPALSALFVARLSPAGTWTQLSTTVGYSVVPTALALAPNGDAVLGGTFTGQYAQFGGAVLVNSTPNPMLFNDHADMFVARLSAAGVWTQAVQAGDSTGNAHLRALALDRNGDVVVAGTFYGPTTAFGPLTLANADPTAPPNSPQVFSADIFVARLSAAGTWTQAVQAGSRGQEHVAALALDTDGTALVGGGWRAAPLQFGSALVLPVRTGSSELYVARLDRQGRWLSASTTTGQQGGYSFASALLAEGGTEALVAGNCGDGTTTFGTTALTSANLGLRGFVARLGSLPTATAPAPQRVLGLAPNPAHGMAQLLVLPAATARPVQLLDALGREVRHTLLPAQASTLALEVASLPAGLYVVHCGTATARLVVE